MSFLAVLQASQLVTLAGPKRPRVGAELSEIGIIRDGGMLIRDGKIDMIGPSDEIEKELGGAEIVDAGGRVVLPGFVDAHTHLVFAGNRLDDFERRARGETYAQIAKAGGGIWSTVEKTRAASDVDLFAQAKKHTEWFLRCGTTTAEAKSGYGLTTEHELKILRIMRRLNKETPLEIVPTFLGAHAVSREMRADEYVDLVTNEMLPRVAQEKLAELGATTADHLEKTDELGIVALKSRNVQPVLLPGSVYALGSTSYPRAREMIETGLAVVLATDFNPGSSPTPSMSMILSLACTQLKMSPAEAITAATTNAAYSLNRGNKIGSLERGKIANFSVFNCDDYRELAYWFGFSQTSS